MKKIVFSLLLFFTTSISNAAVDDSYTKLLLHCNGTDASATITDENSHTVTVVNQAQLDTAQYKFGTASCLFDGTADYLTETDHADWDFGNGNFTYDFWVRFNALPGEGSYMSLIGQRQAAGSNHANALFLRRNSGNYQFYYGYTTDGTTNKALVTTDLSISTGTWYHFAFVRNGTTGTFYLNGTGNATTINMSTDTIYNSTNTNGQARVDSGTTDFNGWLDEIRISKGIARWTSNFTPPTTEYSPPAAPTITSFTPTSAEVPVHLVVTGTGFTSVGTLSINGTNLTGYEYIETTTVHGDIPDGVHDGYIVYTNANGTATSSTQFIVENAEHLAQITNTRLSYMIALFTFIMVFAVFDFLRRIFIKTT